MFTTIIVQPIFNLLSLIYALLPGHNFGLAIIIFTIIIRLLLWPLVKKQLRQVKVMRALQPELKRIKKAAAGNRQKESMLMMELYKERGINPFGSIGVVLLQLPILLGLYSGLRRVVMHHDALISFSYPAIRHLSWMKELAHNPHLFDGTLFGLVDLTRSALDTAGVYWPAMIIVVSSAVVQFFQSKQLAPTDKNAKSLRSLLKGASKGEQADQSEVNAAVTRSTRFLLPAFIFIVTVRLSSALGLYWLVGGLVAYIQQALILRGDLDEMESEVSSAKKTSQKTDGAAKKATIIEGEVVKEPQASTKTTRAKGQGGAARKKRRKR